MDIIYRRPVVSFCIMMITGITAAFLSDSAAVVIGLFVLFAAVLFTSPTVWRKGRTVPCIMLAFFLLGYVEFMAAEHKRAESFVGYHDEDVVIRGVVMSAPEIKGEKLSCIVRANGIKKSGESSFKDTDGSVMLGTLYKGSELPFDYGRDPCGGRLTKPGGARTGVSIMTFTLRKGRGRICVRIPGRHIGGGRARGNFSSGWGSLSEKGS